HTGQLYGGDEILAAAREVGVDEATLRAAEQDLAVQRSERAEFVAQRGRDRMKLFRQAGIWAVVCLFSLFVLGWSTARWVALWGGLALGIQAVRFIFPEDLKEKRERLAKKARAKNKASRVRSDEKGAPPPPALNEEEVRQGLAAILATTSARQKVRV